MTGADADDPPPLRREREVPVYTSGYGVLFDDEVVSPTGHRGRYLRWRWGAHGVLAVPVWHGRFALVPAYRYPVGRVCWEFPRGAAEPDEPVVAAALREMAEESGLVGDDGTLLGLVHADTGIIESGVSVVLVRTVSATAREARPELMESVGRPRWFTPPELVEAIASGGIVCGVTLAALALVWSHHPDRAFPEGTTIP